MIITGGKIVLRAIEPADAKLLQNMINNETIEYMLGGWSFPVSSYGQTEWMRSLRQDDHTLRCMIEEIERNITVGTVILSDIDYKNGTAQLHIKLSPEYQGKGYGTDTIRTITAYAMDELRLQCIYAMINEFNTPSIRLFEKCDFQREGVLKRRVYKKGTYHDVFIYSILREDIYGNRQ
ncbi:MAG: N-acetyltransferase [Herbinix sp.]|jgi:RimJ/RimL family protein N-acetyltransferase|nr:N-acetyltransferase [Herbinix sp.]